MFSLETVGFLLTDFNSVYILSEITNYIFVVLILMMLTHFNFLDRQLFVFWLFYLSTPLFINYIIFQPAYMGDQASYLEEINKSISLGFGILDGLEVTNLSSIIAYKVRIASLALSSIPMFSYLSVTSIAFINKLIALLLFVYLSRRIDPKKLIYFFLVPSFILYSSVGLRDCLIISCATVALVSLLERKIILSLIFLVFVSVIKLQFAPGLIIAWLLMFLVRADLSFKRYLLSTIVGVFGVVIFFDVYAEYLNIYRLAFAIEDCYGGYLACKDVDPNELKISSGLELIWLSIISLPEFMLRPLPWEISGIFKLLIFVESLILSIALAFFIFSRKVYLQNNFWIVLTGFFVTFSLLAITAFNIGTLSRYRFEILWPFLIAFYYASKRNEYSRKELEA